MIFFAMGGGRRLRAGGENSVARQPLFTNVGPMDKDAIAPGMTMGQLMEVCPGARRALFRRYHIGGCASCGFDAGETLEAVCARNGGIDPVEVASFLLEANAEDAKVLIAPVDAEHAARESGARLIDIRTREEHEAVRIEGSHLMGQDFLQEVMGGWSRDTMIVIVDHNGSRGLDAAAYFSGHGFTNVRALRGGIDAWSCEVDPSLPRYTLE
jgi:rhodanese-related sulfurtransferase